MTGGWVELISFPGRYVGLLGSWHAWAFISYAPAETAKTSGFVLCFLHCSPDILLGFLYSSTTFSDDSFRWSWVTSVETWGFRIVFSWPLTSAAASSELSQVPWLSLGAWPLSSCCYSIWFCSWSTTSFQGDLTSPPTSIGLNLTGWSTFTRLCWRASEGLN